MPTKIILYICDICGSKYNTETEALNCEAQTDKPYGKPGLIFEFNGHPVAIMKSENYKHYPRVSVYPNPHEAISQIRLGQLKDEYVGKIDPADPRIPELIEKIKEAHLTPSIWNGTNAHDI